MTTPSATGDAAGPVLVDRRGPVGILTLNRPERRNAITPELLTRLHEGVRAFDADETVRAIVLTGADPAFCAGLDLAALAGGERFGVDQPANAPAQRGALPATGTPVIAAVNGPAVTGGLELVLACDIVLASDRATFADTHARVGVVPGWGMSVLLPAAIGVRRAMEMSLSGNYVDAATASSWGLVNRVVPHDALLDAAVALGEDIAGGQPDAVAALLALYRQTTSVSPDEGWAIEADTSRRWWRERMDAEAIGQRAGSVVERGRDQQPDGKPNGKPGGATAS
jgi:enoyl-CoA hydratase